VFVFVNAFVVQWEGNGRREQGFEKKTFLKSISIYYFVFIRVDCFDFRFLHFTHPSLVLENHFNSKYFIKSIIGR